MNRQQILDTIHGAITEVSPYASDLLMNASDIDRQHIYFVDLGINSIDYTEIALIVMSKLNVDLPIDVFTQTNCVNDVVDMFYELTACNSARVEEVAYSHCQFEASSGV